MKTDKEENENYGIDIISYIQSQAGNLPSDVLLDMIEALTREHKKAVLYETEAKAEKEREKQNEELREKMAQTVCDSSTMELPLDYENLFDGDDRAKNVHTDSIPDALVLSLHNLGRVDIEYIASVTGRDHKSIIATLKGAIYQNPEKWEDCFYKGWETAAEYLSGNLRRKYRIAKTARKHYYSYRR